MGNGVRESATGSQLESYRLLAETATDALIGADSGGNVVLWNDAAAEMFGYDAAAIVGTPVSQLIPERFQEIYQKGFAAAISAGRAARSHLLMKARHKNGEEFPVEVAVSIAGLGSDALAFGIVRKIRERFEKLTLLQESERRLREAEHAAHMGSFEWDVTRYTVTWSDELYRIFGYEPGHFPSTFAAFLERVHRDDRDALIQNVQRSVSTGERWAMDERIIRADTGEVRVLASSVTAVMNALGGVARLCGICQDVTEQRRSEQALVSSEARFRHGFDDAPIGMLLVNVNAEDATISGANNALSYLLGYTKAKLTSMSLSQLLSAEDWPALRTTLERVAGDISAPAQLEVRLRGMDGRAPIVNAAVSRIAAADSASTLIVHFEDITERKYAEEQLRHRALHDSLTGLPNRDLLLDRLGGALARAARVHAFVAVLFLDIDNFKLINDTEGHVAGDEMLRIVAKRLTTVGRSGDTSARVGGDEFVMVCENIAHEEEIPYLARRVADMLSAPMSINGTEFIATVSIGIAVGHDASNTPEQLLRDADLAMYRAKQQGKNSIEVFDEALRRHAIDRVEIERELRVALQRGQIVPYYQPIISLETREIRGFEALARWQHPQRGLLLPKDFLSVAEDTHLIGPLGEQMLQAACSQLATCSSIASRRLSMAVNVSLRQLDGTFAGFVAKRLDEFGVPAGALHVEITESVLLDINKRAGTGLNSLAGLGVKLGIDDFGTGYSSLVYLKRFPVKFLKIDRSFVDGLPNDQEDMAIVEAIVRLGQSLGLTTIAEGVETAEQLEVLRRLQCSSAQGYFIAPPAPAEACTEMLLAG